MLGATFSKSNKSSHVQVNENRRRSYGTMTNTMLYGSVVFLAVLGLELNVGLLLTS